MVERQVVYLAVGPCKPTEYILFTGPKHLQDLLIDMDWTDGVSEVGEA